jgi:ABC-type enterochelin transport system substrate-binding protein
LLRLIWEFLPGYQRNEHKEAKMDTERLHKKIDLIDVHEVKISMLEERLHQNVRSIERAFSEIEDVKQIADNLDKSYAISTAKTKNIERMIWMFVSGMFAVFGFWLEKVLMN